MRRFGGVHSGARRAARAPRHWPQRRGGEEGRRGGIPRSLRETLSAFSSGTGGVVLHGLEEAAGFAPAAGFDPGRIRDALARMRSDDLSPPVRAEIEIDDVDGAPVVRADVAELEPRRKPCLAKTQGEYGGSYIRSGDGDRHLSEYEIGQLRANRGQPHKDREPVADASMDDLDAQANQTLRGLGRQDSTSALSGLVSRGLAQRNGGRRDSTYALPDDVRDGPPQRAPGDVTSEPDRTLTDPKLQQVLSAFSGAEVVRGSEIVAATGLSFATVNRRVNMLLDMLVLEATAPPRSRNRAYRLARKGTTA